MLCAECVKRERLASMSYKFGLVECDIACNMAGEDVLWYLFRTGQTAVDGCMWSINSSSMKNKQERHRVHNCEIECCGFDRDGEPLVRVVTKKYGVRESEEYLINYFKI